MPKTNNEYFTNLEPVSRLHSTYPGAIAAWIAEMEYRCAPAILDVVQRNVEASLLGYIDVPVRKLALEATANWLEGRYGYKAPAGSIFLVADIIAGYESVVRVLTPPAAPIIVPTPAYHLLPKTPRYFGREVIELPCILSAAGRYELDYDKLDELLVPGALFVLTNPYNPVGQVYNREELQRLVAIIEAHDALVFADEVHSPLVLAEGVSHIPYASVSPAAAEHSVTAISASKAFNITGLKTAQLIIPGQLLRQAWKPYAAFYSDGVSRLGLYAAVTAYADPSCSQWLDDVLDTLRANLAWTREYFAQHNPELVLGQHEATYLLWLDLRAYNLPGRPADFLLETAKVAVNDGSEYGLHGYVRLNLALEPTKLAKAVKRIGQALNAQSGLGRN